MTAVTANVTSWASCQKYIQHATDDLLFLQETKTSAVQAENFRTTMKKAGYAFISSAATGSAQHRSGGVMVAWRRI